MAQARLTYENVKTLPSAKISEIINNIHKHNLNDLHVLMREGLSVSRLWVFQTAVLKGDMDVLAWFSENILPDELSEMILARADGSLNLSGFYIAYVAAKTGNITVLDWIRTNS